MYFIFTVKWWNIIKTPNGWPVIGRSPNNGLMLRLLKSFEMWFVAPLSRYQALSPCPPFSATYTLHSQRHMPFILNYISTSPICHWIRYKILFESEPAIWFFLKFFFISWIFAFDFIWWIHGLIEIASTKLISVWVSRLPSTIIVVISTEVKIWLLVPSLISSVIG